MGEPISAIEVSFAIPVEITRDQERRLADLVEEIARANTPVGHAHWLCGQGSKPQYSQADARFLGKSINPDAPHTGEPSFDSSVLYFETYVRENWPESRPRSAPEPDTVR